MRVTVAPHGLDEQVVPAPPGEPSRFAAAGDDDAHVLAALWPARYLVAPSSRVPIV